ncbi:2-oxoacid:acceptor oxidoreductase family protein [Patescibacteria group bacterium]|nr:2-oxoacid:acceptor oxidoreductase family protein [Patescibacteria group bacterium]MBU1722207.1 2-oxoacid:acceptor oxidoreductase family protein [Patescibacteria group bacterium]MBU1901158.1 2-oxoacid:acceptor oxidoreductase family protein [Patescibacteria group bacterium]
MKNILLSGDGGQGVQLIAKILCSVAFDAEQHVTSIPNYGLEQRGGVSLNFIQIDEAPIVYPKFKTADLLLILSPQARERTIQFVGDNTIVIDIADYAEVIKEAQVPRRSQNIFFLGVLTTVLEKENIGITKDAVLILLENMLSKKAGWEENKKSFEAGLHMNLS